MDTVIFVLWIVIKYGYRFKCTYPDKRVTAGNYVLFLVVVNVRREL